MLEDLDKESDNAEDGVSDAWALFEKGLAYQQQIGLQGNIPRQVDFYEGRQWAESSSTANLPKPVINIIKLIVRNKRAGLLSAPVRLEYISSDDQQSGEQFTAFAEYIAKEIKQEDLDAVAVLDGAIKGTYCYHYYWNPTAQGMNGVIDGGLQGEVIDPLNVFVANPCEKDEQKQEWIIVVSRMPLSAAREVSEGNIEDISLISPDERDNRYTEDMEPQDSELVTVLTRYFRIEGEVYYEKATRSTMLHAPRPLNPYIQVRLNAQEDGAIPVVPTDSSDRKGNYGVLADAPKASYYPIAMGSWDERNNCIYGISEVETLLPNQKLINFTMALYCLAVQNVGWGKYLVSEDALNGQVITNEPGQTLVDHSKLGNGIRRMNEPAISQAPLSLVNLIIELTRTMAGATEVLAGEQISSNMSGAAIAQLQIQAQKPIEEMRSRFWRVRERIGKIYEQFFKLYYDHKQYTYQGNESTEQAVFNGENYQQTSFTVVVEAGAATQFSEPMIIANLEQLLDKQIIDPKTYIKLYPKNAMPNRTELLRAVEEQENNAISEIQQQLEQVSGQLNEAKQYIDSQEQNMNKLQSIISENKRLKQMLLDTTAERTAEFSQLQQEATVKISALQQQAEERIAEANQIINEQNMAIASLQGGGDGNAMQGM